MQRHRLISHVLFAWAILAVLAAARPCAAAEKKLSYVQQKDVIYGDMDGVALCMDVFTPTGPKNGVGIIDVASGAWHSDRGKIRDHTLARVYDIFCGKGYTVFAVRPGSITRYSIADMLKHLRLATRFIQDHAKDYGIDPQNLGITGGSAGGHLASLVVISSHAKKDGTADHPFKAVGIFFPPTDFITFGGSAASFGKSERTSRFIRSLTADRNDQSTRAFDVARLTELATAISPALLVDRKQPPFLIIHGDADRTVPLHQSELLMAALTKYGGSSELIVKKGGGHAWLTIAQEVKIMADWFDKELKPKRTS